MVIVKVLKRKDATSVVLAVVVALIVAGFISSPSLDLSTKIVSGQGGLFDNWKNVYLQPAVYAALQLITLELLGRVYVWVSEQIKNRK